MSKKNSSKGQRNDAWSGARYVNRETAQDENRLFRGLDSPLLTNWNDFVEVYPENSQILTPEDIAQIVAINAVARNAVEFPAADCIRNWFYIAPADSEQDALKITDKVAHELNTKIQERLRDLDLPRKLYHHLKNEALTGSSLLYLDVNTKTSGNVSDQVLLKDQIKRLNHINVWDQYTIWSCKVNNYLLSEDYGKIKSFQLQSGEVIDASRVSFLSTRPHVGSVFGSSVLVPLELALDAQKTLIWSIGEIAHSMLFKVLKTKNVDFTKKEDYKDRVRFLRNTLATNDLVAIGEEESLEFKTPGDLPRVQEMSNILWEMISCSTRVPKSILIGKTEGKVAGAEYDHLSYYMRLVAMQRNIIEPILKWIIDIIMVELGVPGEPYKIIFNPLWDISAEEDAKIRKLESEVELNEIKTVQIAETVGDDIATNVKNAYIKTRGGRNENH